MNKTVILKRNIDSIISLTDKDLIEISEAFEVKTLKKNEFFLKEGQVCNFIGLVNYGMLIYFKSMNDGNEVTTDFAFDGDWVTNNLSRLSNSPALINIKAIEDSELLVLKQPVLEELYIKIPKIERLGRILIEQSYLKIVQLSIDLQVLSATERYERLLVRHPDIFQKVQLYHIANYLGIAPKSLSRIRKRNFAK